MEVDALNSPAQNNPPDLTQALKIKPGVRLTGAGVEFITVSYIDFTNTQNRTISILSDDGNGNPVSYMIRTTVSIESGKIEQKTVQINERTPYHKIELNQPGIIDVLKVDDEFGSI